MARPPKPWFWKARDGWYVTVAGERKRLAGGRGAKVTAMERFHELMVERAALPSVDSPRQTVASVLEAYLAHAAKRVSARHYDNLKSVLQRFNDAHGWRLASEVKSIHLTQFVDANDQWKSDWTLNRAVATLVRPFIWGARKGLIKANPFDGVTHAPGMPRRPVTDDEFQRMLRGAPGPRGRPFRQLLIFLRHTGCRPCEAAELRWEHINPELGVIVLPAHKTARRTRKPRSLPMTPVVVRLLIRLRRTPPVDRQHVFVNDRHNPWHRSARSLRIARCRERQGIPKEATLYGVRHQFGTQAIVRGVDLKTLSELMGHTTTRMTEHYLHLGAEAAHLEHAMLRATVGRPNGRTPKGRPAEPSPQSHESPAPSSPRKPSRPPR